MVYLPMDASIIVALIGVAGPVILAVVNYYLAKRIQAQENRIQAQGSTLQAQENTLQAQGNELNWIKTLIRLMLSDSARTNLKQFVEDGSFIADIQPGSGFEWELRHLLALQLIDRVPGKGMRTLFAHHGNQNVKEHLVITQRGYDYLRLFEEAYGT